MVLSFMCDGQYLLSMLVDVLGQTRSGQQARTSLQLYLSPKRFRAMTIALVAYLSSAGCAGGHRSNWHQRGWAQNGLYAWRRPMSDVLRDRPAPTRPRLIARSSVGQHERQRPDTSEMTAATLFNIDARSFEPTVVAPRMAVS